MTWEAGSASEDLYLELRSFDGQWSGWTELEVESLEGTAPGTREGTDPLVVRGADQLEVRVHGGAGLIDAHVAVIDPGEGPAQAPATASSTQGEATQDGPVINTRADWGADESIRFWSPEQGEVTGLVVHHTAGVNDYTQDEVPAIIRGIYHFHTEEWGNGWGDIGYNVLIDRFGGAWEGRYGGVDEPIIGAHAAGLNASTSGVSLMGNHEDAPVTDAAFETLTEVSAWKLGLHEVDPHGSTVIGGTTYDAVMGHQDSSATLCPGVYMYERMDELRDGIAEASG